MNLLKIQKKYCCITFTIKSYNEFKEVVLLINKILRYRSGLITRILCREQGIYKYNMIKASKAELVLIHDNLKEYKFELKNLEALGVELVSHSPDENKGVVSSESFEAEIVKAVKKTDNLSPLIMKSFEYPGVEKQKKCDKEGIHLNKNDVRVILNLIDGYSYIPMTFDVKLKEFLKMINCFPDYKERKHLQKYSSKRHSTNLL